MELNIQLMSIILVCLAYATAFSYFFIFILYKEIKYLKRDNEFSFKSLEERTDRSLKRIEESQREIKIEFYKKINN